MRLTSYISAARFPQMVRPQRLNADVTLAVPELVSIMSVVASVTVTVPPRELFNQHVETLWPEIPYRDTSRHRHMSSAGPSGSRLPLILCAFLSSLDD